MFICDKHKIPVPHEEFFCPICESIDNLLDEVSKFLHNKTELTFRDIHHSIKELRSMVIT